MLHSRSNASTVAKQPAHMMVNRRLHSARGNILRNQLLSSLFVMILSGNVNLVQSYEFLGKQAPRRGV